MSLRATRSQGLLTRLWTPFVEQLRFRNKPNFKNPLPPHWERAKMLRLCEPTYAPEVKICKSLEEELYRTSEIEDNPYGVWLAKKMRRQFYDSKMVAIFHANPFIQHDLLHIRGMLFDNKFDLEMTQLQNAKVAKLALEGTKFEPALRLCFHPFTLGYCSELNVKKLLQLVKKMPAFVLLGVVLEDHLLHKAALDEYASTNIDMARARLCQTLSSAGGKNLSSTLESNALSLSNSLASYVSSNSSPSPPEDKQTEETPAA